MSRKTYEGNVSIKVTTTDKVTVEKNPEGKFNAQNVDELLKAMIEVYHKCKADPVISKERPNLCLGFFNPEKGWDDTKLKCKKGFNPVLLAGYGGTPYLAILPERDVSSTPRKSVLRF